MILSRSLLLAVIVAIMSGCATTQPEVSDEPAKKQLSDVLSDDDILALEGVYDPWEGYNRWMYNFNASFDRNIFIPTVNAYRWVLPEFARTGINNFFSNLGEFRNLANALLQGKFKQSGNTLGRLAVNTTLGIAGLMDPATDFGLYEHKEDFGQTLGYWGVGPGPFLVLPVLGPSTLRDAPGILVDPIYHPIYPPNDWLVEMNTWEVMAIATLEGIDTRSNIGFEYYQTGTPFEYTWVRSLWLEYRKLQIEK
jgi:phospholipid-binding lipoprotein MlaA